MIHPLKLEHASRALYEQQLQILSKEEKLSIQQEIHKHKVKSVPIIFFSMLVAVGALFCFMYRLYALLYWKHALSF